MKHREQRAVIHGHWKYLRMDGNDYLFDLRADARECANLKDRRPELMRELQDAGTRWDAQMPPIPPDAQAHLVFTPAQTPRATC